MSASTFKIKPAGGLKVLDPVTFEPLKPAGEDKPKNEYWLRRIMEGAVVEVTTKATTAAKTEK